MTGKSQSNINTVAAMRFIVFCVISYMEMDCQRAGLSADSIY